MSSINVSTTQKLQIFIADALCHYATFQFFFSPWVLITFLTSSKSPLPL